MGVTEWIVLAVLLLLVLLGLFAWWQIRLVRQGGVEVAMRIRPDLATSRWHLGVGRYRGDDFLWYRITGVLSGPTILSRRGLRIVQRRNPTGSEAYAMPRGSTVLRCRSRQGEVEIAMGTDALTGFQSWLEAAPPGRPVPWAS
jgi:Protein of unknown function (DUF2550)